MPRQTRSSRRATPVPDERLARPDENEARARGRVLGDGLRRPEGRLLRR